MQKQNYDQKMIEIINKEGRQGRKPKLVLHSCCAPCSTACLERLTPFFEVTVFYYNPNIDTLEEYNLRKQEQLKLCQSLGVNFVGLEHMQTDFLQNISGYEREAEGGSRCAICFNLRLSKTAEYAKDNGYDYFTTTLTVSPHKNSQIINEIGQEIGNKTGVSFLPSDFKKQGGFLRSTELARKYQLYRQNYCGCEFSKQNS